jgi:hypothetical protein
MVSARDRRGIVARLLLCAGCLVVASAQAAAAPPHPHTWSGLSGVAPGTPIVVVLNDGRRLDRHVVGTTADALVTLDLTLIASRDRCEQILALARQAPQRYFAAAFVDVDGTRVPIVQRFARAAIASVARPRPPAFALPAPLGWMLSSHAGPCPNCDTAQTALNGGTTPLPSPLPRRPEGDPTLGEILYTAPDVGTPNPVDELGWRQVRSMLPASLQGR